MRFASYTSIKFLALFGLSLFLCPDALQAMGGDSLEHVSTAVERARKRSETATGRLNLFIFSRERKLTLATFSIRTNTRVAQLFSHKIKVIKASTPEELTEEVKKLMEKHPDKMIGNLWLDSHGSMRAGCSLFILGEDTVNCKTIETPRIRSTLEEIAAYCDEKSFVTIGACYGSATYHRPANKYVEERPMNGDSLLIGLGHIFSITPVLGAESWVMTKPFMFGNKWGINGYPMESRFRDELFKPVWERLGMWRMLPVGKKDPIAVNTVSLTSKGDIRFNDQNYLDLERNRKKQEKNMARLEPGLYDGHLKK